MRVLAAVTFAVFVVSFYSSDPFSQSLAQSSMQPPRDPEYPARAYPEDPNEALRRDTLRRDTRGAYREARVIKDGPLAPSENDRNLFSSFLRDRNTGLIRLMPREIYDSEIYHTKKQINIRGGGAYYSFADLTHVYGYGSDIQLERDTLAVGFVVGDYGMLTNLGDVPLADITLKDPRTTYIANYKAATKQAAARAENRRFLLGLTVDGALYRSRLSLEVNATYLLRSIIFGRSDVLVAFRVVRKDDNGSVILLWKRLKEYSATESFRNR